jgi:hypothetical protein
MKGDEVRAYTPDGILVGRFAIAEDFSGRYGFMPLYGDDGRTKEKDGAVAGDLLRFVMYSASDGREHPPQFKSIENVFWKADRKQTRLDLMF